MQVDTPTAVPMANPTAGGGALSLDDYLNAHPPPAPKIKTAPPPSQSKQPPPPKSIPVPVAPKAVGARSSKHTIKLHEKYQALAISQPKFIFEGSSVEGWWGKIVFENLLDANRSAHDDQGLNLPHKVTLRENGHVELAEQDAFSSKQEVKEKLSEGALAVLEELEAKGKVVKMLKRKKGKDSTPVEGQAPIKKDEPTVNYIGQLLEFQRSTNSPQPTYNDYQVGSGFSCLATIEGYPESFGSLEPPYFSNKKAARQQAARCAVEYFQTAGLWPETYTDAGGIKKRKATSNNNSSNNNNSSGSDSTTPIPLNPDAAASPGGSSYAQRVAQLAITLGLPTPQYNFSSVPEAPGLLTASCVFKNSAHAGPIGEVRHIRGRKKAKEECARLTLEYLIGVKEQRMTFAQKMMAGVTGGEAAESVGLGQPVGGDAEVEAGLMRSNGMNGAGSNKGKERASAAAPFGFDGTASGTDEDEMDFEDAVEFPTQH
ncbi:hypothetical protein DM02DRAFT_643637 [Periconia macrospinosa]|uniref:DRBM domain-containing protein n=1 Tax=Periconia macrospinosa TaxID=97972 RepID=A0A2V1DJN7_9PLEO|nr:hypothetical protein DM02DRAFT_643637 [Periconia macrospinosa]